MAACLVPKSPTPMIPSLIRHDAMFACPSLHIAELSEIAVLDEIPGLRARRALIGHDMTAVDDVWMTFDHGRITAIGTGTAPVELPEAPGGFLMPGMVDCHVHLAMSGGADMQLEVAGLDAAAAERAVMRHAEAQVRSGVTTVRDLGSPQDIAVAMSADLSRTGRCAPTVVAAGAITCPGGHGHFLARHAEGPDGYAKAVEAVAETGARIVKLFATGGVVTHGTVPGALQMNPVELDAATRAAHLLGMRVAAHAHGRDGIRNAVGVGVDSVEHFSHLGPDDIMAVKESMTWLVTTIVATERFVAAENRELATADALAKILEHAPLERAALRRAVDAGCRMAVGTDAGTTFNPHGWGMQEQAQHLRKAGMATHDVLRLLTVEGANLLDEPAGVLEVGRRADILCLTADPTQDLAKLSDMAGVVIRGHLVRTARLSPR